MLYVIDLRVKIDNAFALNALHQIMKINKNLYFNNRFTICFIICHQNDNLF